MLLLISEWLEPNKFKPSLSLLFTGAILSLPSLLGLSCWTEFDPSFWLWSESSSWPARRNGSLMSNETKPMDFCVPNSRGFRWQWQNGSASLESIEKRLFGYHRLLLSMTHNKGRTGHFNCDDIDILRNSLLLFVPRAKQGQQTLAISSLECTLYLVIVLTNPCLTNWRGNHH